MRLKQSIPPAAPMPGRCPGTHGDRDRSGTRMGLTGRPSRGGSACRPPQPEHGPGQRPPAPAQRSPRRSPQLLATAARNRSMWVLRFVSGSHITCDSMISGSRDMAAAAAEERGEHRPSRRHPHSPNARLPPGPGADCSPSSVRTI